MATDIWSGNGYWNTSLSDWSTGAPPKAGADVTIASGSALINSPINAINSLTIAVRTSVGIDDPGVAQSIAGDLSNTGDVNIDTGSVLAVGGTLTNSYHLNIGNGNSSVSTTVTAAGLVNTGLIQLIGNGPTGVTLADRRYINGQRQRQVGSL